LLTLRAQTSAEHGNPEDPDFGLWTPGSEVEVCMGVGFPWEWESHGILMGMGIAIY